MSGVSTTLTVFAAESAQGVSGGAFALAGPVGVVAVAVGAGGMLLGLLRRRRVATTAVKAKAVALPVPRTPLSADEHPVG